MTRRRRKKNQKIDPGDLDPQIAAGFTQGASAKEALEEFPALRTPDGIELARTMREATMLAGTRTPTPKFVGRDKDSDLVVSFGGRHFRDHDKIFPEPVFAAVREGMICLHCLEPQVYPYEDMHLESCEGSDTSESWDGRMDDYGRHGSHYMRRHQIMDIIREFEGNTWVGPTKPISEHVARLEERTQKRMFIDRVLEGGQGKIPKEWLKDPSLFPEGPPAKLL